MSATAIGLAGIAGLFLLLALRVPVAIALIVVGLGGTATLIGWDAAIAGFATEAFHIGTFYQLSIIPMFVLMGNLASACGLSRDLYDAAQASVGHWRGGLASATIVGCAGFAAVSGSSVASAVTMGRVALPEMLRYGYRPSLAAGSVAAGGTLGILIPPSMGFVLYAIIVEESIGRLFIAGILPGLMLTALFIAAIAILTRLWPALGPAGRSDQGGGRAFYRALPLLGIIIITIGGIYAGVFTPVEAAGIGAFLVFLVAVWRRAISRAIMAKALLHTVTTTAMIFMIVIGAHVFGPFLALTQIPNALADALTGLNLGPTGTILIILAGYIVLGTFLEGLAMLVITLPLVMPIVMLLGFDPIWFGVIVVIVLEMGLITPPVGVNVFAVKGIARDVGMRDIFIGIAPFWLAMVAAVILLIAFPQIALVLPDTMFG